MFHQGAVQVPSSPDDGLTVGAVDLCSDEGLTWRPKGSVLWIERLPPDDDRTGRRGGRGDFTLRMMTEQVEGVGGATFLS